MVDFFKEIKFLLSTLCCGRALNNFKGGKYQSKQKYYLKVKARRYRAVKKDLTEQLNIIEFLPPFKIALHNFKAEYELKNNGIRGE